MTTPIRQQAEQARDFSAACEQRMRELVFAFAGPAPGQRETLTAADIQDTFKVLQAGADYLKNYRVLVDDLLKELAARDPRLPEGQEKVRSEEP